jgi:hypothetical protein
VTERLTRNRDVLEAPVEWPSRPWEEGMFRAQAVVFIALMSAIPNGASALTYGNATCDQLVDEVVNTKKLFEEAAQDFNKHNEQPATKQDIVQLSLLTQRHDRAFAMLAVKCPEALSNIDFD